MKEMAYQNTHKAESIFDLGENRRQWFSRYLNTTGRLRGRGVANFPFQAT